MEVIAPSSTTDSERSIAARARVRRGADAVLIVLFIAGLCAPLAGVQIGRHRWDIASRSENRRLSTLPLFFRLREAHVETTRGKLRALAKLPGDFKYYLADHFGFRSFLIRLHGLVMVKGLGVTSNPDVLLGKDGWLYLAGESSYEDWRGTKPLPRDQLEQWRQTLELRNAFCAARGIPYLFVVAPSKYDIYPEFMPDEVNQVNREGRLDQLLAYLREKHSPVQVIDLRPELIEAKKEGVRLYHKTDTHWNQRGAWVAYQQIASAMREKLSGTPILSATEFEPRTAIHPGRDLAGLLGLDDFYEEEDLDLVPRTGLPMLEVRQNDIHPITFQSPTSKGPRVVVFRDSFFTAVLPFLSHSVSRGVYLWEDGFDGHVIEAEHPDIVIQELAQRKLMRRTKEIVGVQAVKQVNGEWEMQYPVP